MDLINIVHPTTRIASMEKAKSVFDQTTSAGYSITGPAIALAIRAAIKECTDSSGKLNVSDLYELTCKLDRIKS